MSWLVKGLLALAVLWQIPVWADDAPADTWFTRGERLHFKVTVWGWLKAGEAEIAYEPEDDGTYRVLARAWTNSNLYRVRDRLTIEGHHQGGEALGLFRTDVYTSELNENDYRAHKVLTFLPSGKEVTYHNVQGKQKPVQFSLGGEGRDMISALYMFRKTLDTLKVGESFKAYVAQNDYPYELTLKVVSTEKVDGHKTYLVKPMMQKFSRDGKPIGEVSDRWSIWVRQDGTYLPQKIEAKTKFGRFVAELSRYGTADTPSTAPAFLPATGKILLEKEVSSSFMNPVD